MLNFIILSDNDSTRVVIVDINISICLSIVTSITNYKSGSQLSSCVIYGKNCISRMYLLEQDKLKQELQSRGIRSEKSITFVVY